MHRHLDVAVEADGRVEDAVQSGKRDRAVRLLVHVEGQRVLVEVKQHADDAVDANAALHPVGVLPAVDEPAALVVNVHSPAFVVFTCSNRTARYVLGLETRSTSTS